jgi:hypothetical protein
MGGNSQAQNRLGNDSPRLYVHIRINAAEPLQWCYSVVIIYPKDTEWNV